MNVQFGPVFELWVYFFQRLEIILVKLYFLPESIRSVSTLNCLHAEDYFSISIEDSGISWVSKRTELPHTDASQIHLIRAENSVLGFSFEGALTLATNDLPNDVVLDHIY